VSSIVGSATGNDRNPPASDLDGDFDDAAVLCDGEGGGLASGTAWYQGIAAFVDLPLDQSAK
jgi:hypothetical protein